MLRSRSCDYSDVYMSVKGTITAANTEAQNAANNSVIINCMSRINNKQMILMILMQ